MEGDDIIFSSRTTISGVMYGGSFVSDTFWRISAFESDPNRFFFSLFSFSFSFPFFLYFLFLFYVN